MVHALPLLNEIIKVLLPQLHQGPWRHVILRLLQIDFVKANQANLKTWDFDAFVVQAEAWTGPLGCFSVT